MTEEQKNAVRRHFTLPRELNAQLEHLAEENHNGNASRFIRTAISDRKRTLSGKDDIAINSLNQTIETLAEELDELRAQLEERQNNNQNSAIKDEATTEDTENPSGDQITKVKRKVQRKILDEGPHTLQQLAEEIEADSLTVQDAVQALIDHGYLEQQSSEDETQYEINR